jgi:hypothetical protein
LFGLERRHLCVTVTGQYFTVLYTRNHKMPRDDNNGWKTITKKDKKRVMRKRGRAKPVDAADTESEGIQVLDANRLDNSLTECRGDLRDTWFYKKVKSILIPSYEQMVCYGIGNFSVTPRQSYSAALWQLAFALCLSSDLDDASLEKQPQLCVYYFDPCSTVLENRFLSERGVTVLQVNDQGKRLVSSQKTLFIMPHCPCRLYENVVWANWSNLSNVTILGNSLVNHADSLLKNNCPSLQTLRERDLIQENLMAPSKKDTKEAVGNFIGAFNDLYLTTFRFKPSEWPPRPAAPDTNVVDDEVL